jgi:hypothetical protein
MEFTDVELAGGVELAASMENGVAGLVEKAVVDPRVGEGHDGWEAQWRGRKTGCRAWARWR